MRSTASCAVPGAFFFGRSRDGEAHSFEREVPIHAYFFDHVRRCGQVGKLHAVLLELFCGAEQGATVGYRRSALGGMVPQLDDERNPRLTDWGLPLVHQAILAFVDAFCVAPAPVNPAADTRPAVAALLAMFSASPTWEEACAWGVYPFEYGRSGLITGRLASALRPRHVVRAVRDGMLATRAGFEWTEASLTLTSAPVRYGLSAIVGVRRRLGGSSLSRALRRLRPS